MITSTSWGACPGWYRRRTTWRRPTTRCPSTSRSASSTSRLSTTWRRRSWRWARRRRKRFFSRNWEKRRFKNKHEIVQVFFEFAQAETAQKIRCLWRWRNRAARYKNCQRQKIPLDTKKNKNNKNTPPQKVTAAVFVVLLNRYRPLKSQQTTEYLALTHLPRPLPTEGFLATAVSRSAFSSAARRRRRSWRRRQQVERCRKVLFRRGLVEVVVKSFNRNSRSWTGRWNSQWSRVRGFIFCRWSVRLFVLFSYLF